MIAAGLLVIPTVVSAQKKSVSTEKVQFDVGSKVLTVALVAGSTDGYGTYGAGGTGIGLSGAFEVGVANIANVVRLGVGGSVGFLRGSLSNYYDLMTIPVVGFVNGHYQIKQVPKLDVYAGPVLGFAHRSYDYKGSFVGSASASTTEVAAGVQAGGRYAFAPGIAGNLQLSVGNALPWLTAGISFKF
jgi:hypothetical protein